VNIVKHLWSAIFALPVQLHVIEDRLVLARGLRVVVDILQHDRQLQLGVAYPVIE